MYRHYIKRVIDVFAAICMIVLCSWLFVLIMLIYVVTLQLPVFFVQKRIGKDGRLFRVIKFRTLKTAGASLQERKFRWGTFLRFTALDELPQLFNVLAGDMSFTGPRPLPVEYADLFTEEQYRRHAVRPGITGWAQVNGRHSISWEEKFRYDLYYVDHLSPWLDIKITFRTILLILSFKKDLSLEEQPFRG